MQTQAHVGNKNQYALFGVMKGLLQCNSALKKLPGHTKVNPASELPDTVGAAHQTRPH